ncbi:response regulator [Pantoea eucrina]|uniref:Response regulator n=1 Tax=Pantoea eucrina TaxID=472693 RepID=A0ABU5LJL3_9GAMM|nr:response regulator [Pantoea eucrina]MDZ7280128.1 response regulator [Pantoea eucrina]
MNAKVWLVDEDVSVRESLGFLLKALDYDVADYADLAAFDVATARQQPLRGCLLVNLSVPEVGWFAEQENRHPLLSVIIMTGQSTLEACRRALGERAFAFYTKPLEIAPLLQSVQQATMLSSQRVLQGR